MPINCNQPNVYQYGESWTTEANEYHTTKYQETNSGGTGSAIAITYRVFVNQENSALPNLALTLTLTLALTLTLT